MKTVHSMRRFSFLSGPILSGLLPTAVVVPAVVTIVMAASGTVLAGSDVKFVSPTLPTHDRATRAKETRARETPSKPADKLALQFRPEYRPAPVNPRAASRVATTTETAGTGLSLRDEPVESNVPVQTYGAATDGAATINGKTEDDRTCPLCKTGFTLPCGKCPSCKAGFPCEYAPCRHCVQPRDLNTCSFCDLTAGDEPCGTCDSCMARRSAPCEHADDGHGPKGEFNPYHQNPMFSTPSRLWTGFFNNGAHRFPIYYNPAPYYRPTWNPAMWGGYMRPFTFRWTCEYCHYEECQCLTGPRRGQTVYGYNCKFCGRNPCACGWDICNVNKNMDPAGTSQALKKAAEDANTNTTMGKALDERGIGGTVSGGNGSGGSGAPTLKALPTTAPTTSAAAGALDNDEEEELPNDWNEE
ncbi:MAG TPA: hypothetical protein DEB39_04025 [Planctomycetaceae bacterium]|nr:hypothetical protein [Planctomycetaceae bacterium]